MSHPTATRPPCAALGGSLMGNNPDARGNRGGRRAHRPHKTVDVEREARRRAALAEVAEHERKLNRRIEVETLRADAEQRERHERAAVEAAIEAERARVDAERARVEAEDERLRRRTDWTLGQARRLVRDGYSAEHAASVTGWDPMWLADAVGEEPPPPPSRGRRQ